MGTSGFGSALLGAAEGFRRRPALGYLVSVLAFVLALVVRFAVNAVLPAGFPYLTFFPAVLLTAFFCGTGPGIFTALLSVVAAWYWFIAPFDSFALDTQSAVAVLFFVVILTADIFIIHVMHSAMVRLQLSQRRTDDLLDQQRTLFEELQHRTANNISFISALLSMHKRRAVKEMDPVAAFEDATARLDSMARIHRRLYDPTSSDLPLDDYLRDLVGDIFESAGRDGVRLDVRTDIGRLDVNRLITLSLVISELATNAVKHAFAGGAGTLSIRLEPQGDALRLTVRDDGPGFPEGFDPSASDRLGFRVLSSFARSLDGTLAFRSDRGAITELVFPVGADRRA